MRDMVCAKTIDRLPLYFVVKGEVCDIATRGRRTVAEGDSTSLERVNRRQDIAKE